LSSIVISEKGCGGSQSQVATVLALAPWLVQQQQKNNCSYLLSHHPRRQGKYSGWMTFTNIVAILIIHNIINYTILKLSLCFDMLCYMMFLLYIIQ
jgi:hypothetical protein